MKVMCGTPEACIDCGVNSVVDDLDRREINRAATDLMTGRSDLESKSFLGLRALVDDALEGVNDQLPTIDISTATTLAVRRMSSGKCEVFNQSNIGEI